MHAGKSLNKVVIIYIITSVFVALVFFTTSTRISEKYLNSFIRTQNELEVSSILAFMEKEIAMSRKLAEDPLIRKWMMNQNDEELTRDVEQQLTSYREFIS